MSLKSKVCVCLSSNILYFGILDVVTSVSTWHFRVGRGVCQEEGKERKPGAGHLLERWVEILGHGKVSSVPRAGRPSWRVICVQEEARTRVWKRVGVAGVERGS